MERGPVSEGLRKRVIVPVSAGAVIGVVEVVLAISFAVLVFSGFLEDARPSGIGIFLVAASLTLAILAWRAGVRGVVGSVQDAAVPVLAIVASSAALHTFGGVDQAFLTVVAATMIVTLLTALTFLVLGNLRLGNLARFIPYPVVGGFLAGTGWLLMKGGIAVAASADQLGDRRVGVVPRDPRDGDGGVRRGDRVPVQRGRRRAASQQGPRLEPRAPRRGVAEHRHRSVRGDPWIPRPQPDGARQAD